MVSYPIFSPHSSDILAALQFQGQSNDCGPYTTAIVLNAMLGLNIDAAQLARQMDRPVWRGPRFVIRRVPNWATFPWGIADVLREHGLEASWRFFTPTDRLYEGLEKGYILIPVIGSLKPLWSHVLTLVAWDPQQGWGVANTQFSHHNIHWVGDDYFKSRWNVMLHLLVEVKTPIGA